MSRPHPDTLLYRGQAAARHMCKCGEFGTVDHTDDTFGLDTTGSADDMPVCRGCGTSDATVERVRFGSTETILCARCRGLKNVRRRRGVQ